MFFDAYIKKVVHQLFGDRLRASRDLMNVLNEIIINLENRLHTQTLSSLFKGKLLVHARMDARRAIANDGKTLIFPIVKANKKRDGIYIASVAEYITAELLEVAGSTAIDRIHDENSNNYWIKQKDLDSGLIGDVELRSVLSKISITS